MRREKGRRTPAWAPRAMCPDACSTPSNGLPSRGAAGTPCGTRTLAAVCSGCAGRQPVLLEVAGSAGRWRQTATSNNSIVPHFDARHGGGVDEQRGVEQTVANAVARGPTRPHLRPSPTPTERRRAGAGLAPRGTRSPRPGASRPRSIAPDLRPGLRSPACRDTRSLEPRWRVVRGGEAGCLAMRGRRAAPTSCGAAGS